MNTEEKSLVKVNEDSLLSRIKGFFKRLFRRNKITENIEEINSVNNAEEDRKEAFMNYIKNIEDDETKLNNLQKQYRDGEIKEEDLSEEQVNQLCALYDRQISNLRKANEMKMQKLLAYRRKLQAE